MYIKRFLTGIAAGLIVVGVTATSVAAARAPKPPMQISFDCANYYVVKGDSATINVIRTASHGPASVTFATSSVSAIPGTDYTEVSTTVDFKSGQTLVTVSVPTFANSVGEPTVKLTLSAPSRRWSLGDVSTATLTLQDTPPPSAPTNLTANVVNGSGVPYVSLSWTAATGSLDHYTVLSSEVSGGPYSFLGSATSTSYDVTPVPSVTTYFVVEAVSGTGATSDYSNEASVVPPVIGHGLYWAVFNTGIIGAANPDGTGVTTVAAGPTGAFGVAVDASHLYWAVDASSGGGAIMEADLNGANSHALISGLNNPYGVAVDASHIYWTSYGDNTIMRADLSGSNVTTLVSSTWEPAAIAVDASHIYWVDTADSWIWMSNLDGSGAQHIVATDPYPFAIAVGASGIYWAVTGSNSGTDGAIWTAGLDGSSPTTLVASQAHPDGIAVDASHVYWANANTGSILSANLNGSGVTTLVSDQGMVAGVAVSQ